ncbi:YoaK family protein [Nevskia ramosa]|uniref:YoaK family protein n=1 Tax=Nevskia ramosa TaxID=64002 RepID=UPI00041CD367|nr:YoaK family protein [Nevskia ramosa]
MADPISITPPAIARPGTVAPLLSFVAGYVDTVGFIALFGLFTAHVTGNFVLIGASLVQPAHAGVLAKLLALPVFIAAVAMTTAFVRRRERRQRRSLTPVLWAQIVLLGGFLVVALLAAPIIHADAPGAVIAGLLGVAAMGVQNAASRLIFTSLSPTTVMTGNVTQVVIDSVDLLRGSNADNRAVTKARISKMWPPVLAFAVGAAAGAVLLMQIGIICLLLPMLAIVLVSRLAIAPEVRS